MTHQELSELIVNTRTHLAYAHAALREAAIACKERDLDFCGEKDRDFFHIPAEALFKLTELENVLAATHTALGDRLESMKKPLQQDGAPTYVDPITGFITWE
jgi:hypothetical protein